MFLLESDFLTVLPPFTILGRYAWFEWQTAKQMDSSCWNAHQALQLQQPPAPPATDSVFATQNEFAHDRPP